MNLVYWSRNRVACVARAVTFTPLVHSSCFTWVFGYLRSMFTWLLAKHRFGTIVQRSDEFFLGVHALSFELIESQITKSLLLLQGWTKRIILLFLFSYFCQILWSTKFIPIKIESIEMERKEIESRRMEKKKERKKGEVL